MNYSQYSILKKLSVCHVPVVPATDESEGEGLFDWELKQLINHKT